jgi:hypothetical protein
MLKTIKSLIRTVASIAALLIILPGCYSPGLPTTPSNTESGSTQLINHSQSTLDGILIRGKTTKQDVIALFGEPQQAQAASDGSIAVYSYKKETYGFMYHSTSKTLYLYFDLSGTLTNFTFQEYSV